MRRSKRKVEGKDDGYLVLRHGLSKGCKEGRQEGVGKRGKERNGRRKWKWKEELNKWVFDDCYRCSQQRWRGRRNRTKDGGRNSKGKMRVKETKLG